VEGGPLTSDRTDDGLQHRPLRITALASHRRLPLVAVGAEDGSVTLLLVTHAAAAAAKAAGTGSHAHAEGLAGAATAATVSVYAFTPLHREWLFNGPAAALEFCDVGEPYPILACLGGTASDGGAERESGSKGEGECLVAFLDLRLAAARGAPGMDRPTSASSTSDADPALSAAAAAAGASVHGSAVYAYASLPHGRASLSDDAGRSRSRSRAPRCMAWAGDAAGVAVLFLGCATGHLLSLAVPPPPEQARPNEVSDLTGQLLIRTRLHTGFDGLAATAALSSPEIAAYEARKHYNLRVFLPRYAFV
jgi:hypothetical protein